MASILGLVDVHESVDYCIKLGDNLKLIYLITLRDIIYDNGGLLWIQ